MEYLLVASPEFIQKYFSHQDLVKCLIEAPAIKFDKNDMLHEKYLEKYFGIRDLEIQFHIIPSVNGFKKYAILGNGYALIPKIDIVDELKNKQLVQLYKDKVWMVPLYWHHWEIESEFYKKFNKDIIQLVTKRLKSI